MLIIYTEGFVFFVCELTLDADQSILVNKFAFLKLHDTQRTDGKKKLLIKIPSRVRCLNC
jgi:hypothetical protein